MKMWSYQLTLKKYKKENGNFFDSKKETESDLTICLQVDLLPSVIEFVKIWTLQNQEVQDIKTLIYQKLTDYDFIKVIKRRTQGE